MSTTTTTASGVTMSTTLSPTAQALAFPHPNSRFSPVALALAFPHGESPSENPDRSAWLDERTPRDNGTAWDDLDD